MGSEHTSKHNVHQSLIQVKLLHKIGKIIMTLILLLLGTIDNAAKLPGNSFTSNLEDVFVVYIDSGAIITLFLCQETHELTVGILSR